MTDYIEVRGVRIGEGIPKICVPIVGRTKEEIKKAAKAVKAERADVAEWRADWFAGVTDSLMVQEVIAELRLILGEIPLLFTFRTAGEGGEKAISVEEYVRLNQAAVETGKVELIDVELFTGDAEVAKLLQSAHKAGVKVIMSNHDFEKTPKKEEIVNRLCRMKEFGADIPKIAVMPKSNKDVLTLLAATEEASCRIHGPVITMSMAGTGLVSRLCGEVFGSALTFGTAGMASAPGQIDALKLRDILTVIHDNIAQ